MLHWSSPSASAVRGPVRTEQCWDPLAEWSSSTANTATEAIRLLGWLPGSLIEAPSLSETEVTLSKSCYFSHASVLWAKWSSPETVGTIKPFLREVLSHAGSKGCLYVGHQLKRCYLHIVVSCRKLISSALPFHIWVPSHRNKILEPWTYNWTTFALTSLSPGSMHTHFFFPGTSRYGKLLAIKQVKACRGWELKSPPKSQLPAVSRMRAERTIPESGTWSLKKRIPNSATTAPSHPAFSVALGPTATQAVKKSWNQWWIPHASRTTSLSWSSSLVSLPCPAIRASYLFSLALALKSSITFLNRVTVKSPPSASSAIILWEGNPLLWFTRQIPHAFFTYLTFPFCNSFVFSFMILNNTLLFENCCDRSREQWLYLHWLFYLNVKLNWFRSWTHFNTQTFCLPDFFCFL